MSPEISALAELSWLARAAAVGSKKGYPGAAQDWLPFLDTYRTMCRAPEPAFRRVLEGIRELRLAAQI